MHIQTTFSKCQILQDQSNNKVSGRRHAPAMVVFASVQSPADKAPKVLLLSGQPAAAARAPAGWALPVMVPGQQGASPEGASGGPPQARK